MSLKMPRPWLHKKSGIFYLRIIVPADLKAKAKGETLTVTISGKPQRITIGSHLKVSLGTKDPTEAKRRFVDALAQAENVWSGLRAVSITLGKEQRRSIAMAIHEMLVTENGDEPGEAEHWSNNKQVVEKGFEPGRTTESRLAILEFLVGTLTDEALSERGLKITDESRNDLLQDVGRAMRDAFGRFEAKAVIEDSDRRYFKPNALAPLTAEALLAEWAAERRPAAATLRSYRGKFRRLELILGFDDIRRVTPQHVVQFKTARLSGGTNPGTVTDDVLGMGAVCNWAVTNGKLPTNPFAGLAPKPVRSGEPSRYPFDDDEAVRILLAAREETGWQRWMPWLLCFTGARISELAELRRRDVRERDGVIIFDIVPLAVRAGKNSIAQRMLPLHPALIAEGFLDYVATLPDDLEGPLFPSITPDKNGGRIEPATHKSGRWVHRIIGKQEKKGPNHSWRHRLEDELRKVRAHPEMQDAITGRNNPRNAGAGYGKGFRGMPDEVLKDLCRIPSPVPPLATARDDGGERNATTTGSLLTPAAASS